MLEFSEALGWKPDSIWQIKLESEPYQIWAIKSKYLRILHLHMVNSLQIFFSQNHVILG